MNGDNFDDLVLAKASRMDIVFGRSGTSDISLSTIDGVNATSISETANKWGFLSIPSTDGFAASGDVNGDGFEDVTMASSIGGTHTTRHVWTIMGRSSWDATYDLDAVASELPE